METLYFILASVVAFLTAITIHEGAHAWMANRLGDPTAKLMGRLTLNPIAHMDLYGTVLIPLFLILARSPLVFGWAKPVQFDPYNLRNPRKDSALISLAGPVSNLMLAVVLSLILNFFGHSLNSVSGFLPYLLYKTMAINVVLAVFNFIPLHPLDGGKIFIGLLPEKDALEADIFLNRYGMIILVFLMFPIFGGISPLSTVISPIINFIMGILVSSPSLI